MAPGSTPGMRLQQQFLSCAVKSPPRPLTTQQRRQARAIGRPAGGPLTHALQQVRPHALQQIMPCSRQACTRSCLQGAPLSVSAAWSMPADPCTTAGGGPRKGGPLTRSLPGLTLHQAARSQLAPHSTWTVARQTCSPCVSRVSVPFASVPP